MEELWKGVNSYDGLPLHIATRIHNQECGEGMTRFQWKIRACGW